MLMNLEKYQQSENIDWYIVEFYWLAAWNMWMYIDKHDQQPEICKSINVMYVCFNTYWYGQPGAKTCKLFKKSK